MRMRCQINGEIICMKKISLVVFGILLFMAIPLTVSLLKQKQETKSHASASTNFYFMPTSTSANPLQKNVGDTISLDFWVDPGNNIVTFIRYQVQFDSSKLAL